MITTSDDWLPQGVPEPANKFIMDVMKWLINDQPMIITFIVKRTTLQK